MERRLIAELTEMFFSSTKQFFLDYLHHIEFAFQSIGETKWKPLYKKNSDDVELAGFYVKMVIKFGSIVGKKSFELKKFVHSS